MSSSSSSNGVFGLHGARRAGSVADAAAVVNATGGNRGGRGRGRGRKGRGGGGGGRGGRGGGGGWRGGGGGGGKLPQHHHHYHHHHREDQQHQQRWADADDSYPGCEYEYNNKYDQSCGGYNDSDHYDGGGGGYDVGIGDNGQGDSANCDHHRHRDSGRGGGGKFGAKRANKRNANAGTKNSNGNGNSNNSHGYNGNHHHFPLSDEGPDRRGPGSGTGHDDYESLPRTQDNGSVGGGGGCGREAAAQGGKSATKVNHHDPAPPRPPPPPQKRPAGNGGPAAAKAKAKRARTAASPQTPTPQSSNTPPAILALRRQPAAAAQAQPQQRPPATPAPSLPSPPPPPPPPLAPAERNKKKKKKAAKQEPQDAAHDSAPGLELAVVAVTASPATAKLSPPLPVPVPIPVTAPTPVGAAHPSAVTHYSAAHTADPAAAAASLHQAAVNEVLCFMALNAFAPPAASDAPRTAYAQHQWATTERWTRAATWPQLLLLVAPYLARRAHAPRTRLHDGLEAVCGFFRLSFELAAVVTRAYVPLDVVLAHRIDHLPDLLRAPAIRYPEVGPWTTAPFVEGEDGGGGGGAPRSWGEDGAAAVRRCVLSVEMWTEAMARYGRMVDAIFVVEDGPHRRPLRTAEFAAYVAWVREIAARAPGVPPNGGGDGGGQGLLQQRQQRQRAWFAKVYDADMAFRYHASMDVNLRLDEDSEARRRAFSIVLAEAAGPLLVKVEEKGSSLEAPFVVVSSDDDDDDNDEDVKRPVTIAASDDASSSSESESESESEESESEEPEAEAPPPPPPSSSSSSSSSDSDSDAAADDDDDAAVAIEVALPQFSPWPSTTRGPMPSLAPRRSTTAASVGSPAAAASASERTTRVDVGKLGLTARETQEVCLWFNNGHCRYHALVCSSRHECAVCWKKLGRSEAHSAVSMAADAMHRAFLKTLG
ncbi:hypothetical protein DFJ73DRAFT_792781 [Zopfochytrium polystomum]|nr:hypothetical protein DFJ73DRAFT_792781 [Zopfochytrium polystomum]